MKTIIPLSLAFMMLVSCKTVQVITDTEHPLYVKVINLPPPTPPSASTAWTQTITLDSYSSKTINIGSNTVLMSINFGPNNNITSGVSGPSSLTLSLIQAGNVVLANPTYANSVTNLYLVMPANSTLSLSGVGRYQLNGYTTN